MAVIPKIVLNKFKWTTNQSIYVCGFVWINGEYIEKQDFIDLISAGIESFEQFHSFSKSLNGQFSIVVVTELDVWVICSQTWSYPIFYFQGETRLAISDDPKNLSVNSSDIQTDEFIELYFKNFGVTPGNSTLANKIWQVRPGELIRFQKQGLSVESFLPKRNTLFETPPDANKLKVLFISSFEKYYNHLKNKQVLLPLTRGYDSRLIACLLKEYGHNKVVCATYGRDGNIEVNTAKSVAEALGYKHIFIQYNNELIKDFVSEDIFKNYIHYVGHWSSMPFFQEYFSTKYLIENKIINSDTVVLPGHMGDFAMGSHLKEEYETAYPNEIVSDIILNKGSSLPLNRRNEQRLRTYIANKFFSENENKNHWINFESWDLEDRQCKFIINSALVYPFFNINLLMPLFDKEIFDFAQKMPFDQKINCSMYNKVVEEIFRKNKVGFDLKTTKASKAIFPKIKKFIISNSPYFIKKWYYPTSDIIFYKEITQKLIQSGKEFDFIHPMKPHFYNGYIIQWYLRLVQKHTIENDQKSFTPKT